MFELAFSPTSDVPVSARSVGDGISSLATAWTVADRQELYTVEVDTDYGIATAVTFSPDAPAGHGRRNR